MSTVGGSWSRPKIVNDGLALYLDASAPNSYSPYFTPTTWKDLSGNNNSGSLISGSIFNPLNGGSIVFDGVNDYVNCGPTTNTISNIFTYCFWATPIQIDGGSLLGNSKQGGGVHIFMDFTSLYLIKQDIVVMGSCSTSSALSNWNYYCISYSSPNITFYINGNLITTGTFATTFDFTDSERWVGSRASFGAPFQPYRGRISTVQLYNRVLTLAEIQQNYNATKGRFGL
jgi:hypothetical protein